MNKQVSNFDVVLSKHKCFETYVIGKVPVHNHFSSCSVVFDHQKIKPTWLLKTETKSSQLYTKLKQLTFLEPFFRSLINELFWANWFERKCEG